MKNFLPVISMLMIMMSLNAQDDEVLKTGDKIPVFSAPDENGKIWSVTDYIGTRTIVVYFYPAAMTGGCTKQACSYRDALPELEKIDAIVIGISGDEVENLKYFKGANNLNFTLLSDKDGSIARKFGVPLRDGGTIEQELEGVPVQLSRGVTAGRWTFIADKDGEIRYINRSVKAAEDAANVLEVISELNIR